MTSEQQTNDEATTTAPTGPTSSGESLEEMTERTAEVMAEARKQVDRARATLHDEILPATSGDELADLEDKEQVDSENKAGGPDKDDTRGAWPNWNSADKDS